MSKPPPPKAVSAPPAPDASRVMLLFVLIVATLYFGKDVLVPVVVALLLTFIIAPLVNLLRRIHLGRVPSVLLAVIVALGIVVAIVGVVGTQVAQLSSDLPSYVGTIEAKVAAVRQYTIGRLSHLIDRVGRHDSTPVPTMDGAVTAQQRPALTPAREHRSADAAAPMVSPMTLAENYLSPVISPLATFGIVFVVTVFALLQREDLRDRLIRLVGSTDLHRTTVAIDDGGQRLSRYYLTQLSINTGFGVVIGIGLLLIGVPKPILWGIVSALLRFVPYVGSFISAVLPMAMAAAVEPGWAMVLWTLGLYVLVEGITGQVVEPLLYGHSTGLSPFSVVVAAIFWSWLWGPIGLILSTPLTLCLVVMGRHIERLEFLDIILGDRPALTPVESLYQRILAGDADEAQEHAELLLKERSLSTYYDEVVLKSLQLAANDAQRGAVNAEQLDRIRSTIKAVVDGLGTHDDVAPSPEKADKAVPGLSEAEQAIPRNPQPADVDPPLPPAWRGPSAVLCIAGRGPLDEAAASILVQLLGKHGLKGRVVGFGEVSRDAIDRLDTTGVAMACLSYLDISGSPAHLRFLIRRLRQKLPRGVPILVGLWPTQDSALTDTAVQRQIGADYFTASLSGAVTICVETAGSDRPAAETNPSGIQPSLA